MLLQKMIGGVFSVWGKYEEAKYKRLFKKKGSSHIDDHKKVYYIIRRYPRGAGFFSNYLCVLSHIAYAMEMKYIPVVDMKRYPTLYSERTEINGTRNAWEYYFHQPEDCSLKAAYRSNNYILSESGFQEQGGRFLSGAYMFPLEDGVTFYHPMCRRVGIRRFLEEELEAESRALSLTEKKTLGIHIRGTDMSGGGYGNHPVSAGLQSYIDMTEKLIRDDGEIQQIFLATDEEKAEKCFKEHFGAMVRTTRAYRAKGDTTRGIHYSAVEGRKRKNHNYLLGKEVIKDAYLLSKCDKLICGFSNVASVAIIWNHNRYEKLACICNEEYGKKLTEELTKRQKADSSRYIISF